MLFFNPKKRIFQSAILKPTVFFLLLALFFPLYNIFLVDRSLETLRFSLSNVALADTVGPVSYAGALVQVQLVKELSRPGTDSTILMNLSYAGNTLEASSAKRPNADIVSIMQEAIGEKQKQRPAALCFMDNLNTYLKTICRKLFVKVSPDKKRPEINPLLIEEIADYEKRGDLEKLVELYNNIIEQFPDGKQTPSLMLRLAYVLQRLGRVAESEKVYRQVIDRFSRSAEAVNAKLLLDGLRGARGLHEEALKVGIQAARETDIEKQQKFYYQAALVYLSAFSVENAKENFKKAVLLLPNTNIAQESMLRIGICEKILGNFKESQVVFDKLAAVTDNPRLKTLAQYQSAEFYRNKGDYDKLVEFLKNTLKQDSQKTANPELLFYIGSTYLFDLKDPLQAKEAFEKLRRNFPALNLTYPGTNFAEEYIAMDIPPRLPDEISDIMRHTWLEALIPKKLLMLIAKASMEFTKRVTGGVQEIIILEEYDVGKGGYITIDLTQKMLNSYLKRWFFKGNPSKVWDVSMEFKGDSELQVNGTIHLADNFKIPGVIYGKFKIFNMHIEPYWISEKGQTNFLIYIPEKALLANIPLPKGIINILLRASMQQFNRDFPLLIEEFKLDKDHILFAGPVREDLRAEIEESSYGLRHLETKDSDSGFIYGRRK